MLRILNQLPHGLVDVDPEWLVDALGGPSLIHVPGERMPPVFVAVLLHGNETTGWQAIRRVLAAFGERPLPRAMDLFIGNVHAARSHRRRLDGQPDYNRIWRGYHGPEGTMVEQLLEAVRARPPLVALDIHNTSGRNPPYACYHRRAPGQLALARAFSDTVVCVEHPNTLLANALSATAPAITMECGRPGDLDIEAQVVSFVESLLCTQSPAAAPSLFQPPPVLKTVATVRVPDDVSFAVDDDEAQLCLLPDLDAHNFCLMPPGTPVARVRADSNARLEVLDERGRDVAERYFRRNNGHLVTASAMMPSLLTLNENIIRQDCLCYVMEPLPESAAVRDD